MWNLLLLGFLTSADLKCFYDVIGHYKKIITIFFGQEKTNYKNSNAFLIEFSSCFFFYKFFYRVIKLFIVKKFRNYFLKFEKLWGLICKVAKIIRN
jgi:hypothetical protein